MLLPWFAALLGLLGPGPAGEGEAPAPQRSWFVMLESGAGDAPLQPEVAAQRQAQHIANLVRLYHADKSPLAGPLGDGGKLRGIVVVEAADRDALAAEFAEDPFVAHGHLVVRAAELEVMTGSPRKVPDDAPLTRYVLALLQPDDEPDDATARAIVSRIHTRIAQADGQHPLAYGGLLLGDDDLLGMFLFHGADKQPVQALFDAAIDPDTPATARLYTQYLAEGLFAPAGVAGRIALIGASATHGFGNGVPLAAVLEQAISGEHAPILDVSKALQFMDPVAFGEEQIDACVEHDPSLVIGVDFLFWYAYALPIHGDAEIARRMEYLDLGLEQLARLRCPVAIGTLPDMRGANEQFLSPQKIPSPAALAALNARIAEWAEARSDVLLLPVADWVATLREGEWRISAEAGTERRVSVTEAMMDDGLHPTQTGALLLADRMIAALRDRFGAAADLQFDVTRELQRLRVATPASGADR